MRYIQTFLLILLWTKLFSQSDEKNFGGKFDNQIVYKTCEVVAFIVDDGSFGIMFPYQKGLTNYFSDYVPLEKTKHFIGKLFVQIILMNDGKACCKSISIVSGNFTLNEIDQLGLDSVINKMPRWTISKPTTLGKRKANYSIALELQINGKSGLAVKYNSQRYIIGKDQ